MLSDWIIINSIRVSNAERLYPDGLDWNLKSGVNTIVGGTGLGKTTLVFALQYCIFDKLIATAGLRIEREFFKDRLTARSEDDVKGNPPDIEVTFSLGDSIFTVKRNLLTGAVIRATCDNIALKATEYQKTVADKIVGISTFQDLGYLQSHLLFFGDNRYLLAWDNRQQNELLNFLFSDQETYQRLTELWEQIESLDSEARNNSAQASRMEKDVETASKSSNVRELQRRNQLSTIIERRNQLNNRATELTDAIVADERILVTEQQKATSAYEDFHSKLEILENDTDIDLDEGLLAEATAGSPTTASLRRSLEDFLKAPNSRSCPCCGVPGIAPEIARLIVASVEAIRDGRCVVCSKDTLPQPATHVPQRESAADGLVRSSAAELQQILFQIEQTKSRLDANRSARSEAAIALSRVQSEEVRFLDANPPPAFDALKIAISELRKRQRSAERKRDSRLLKVRRELSKTNRKFEEIESDIATSFTKYATLYLDEPCTVELLTEKSLPGKKGPQVKAPHSAFYPVVSGQLRTSPQSLSEAQRSFIDLAFRMAIIEVWHKRTDKTVTMIIETPEGTVDIAYMERVATMLRTFGKQGHTLLVTTNLSNDIFLPELLAVYPLTDRDSRILNLIELGNPRRVQIRHKPDFNRILQATLTHPKVR
jgi:DNA repair exonuclease SbcCD ATPase subunit